MSQTISTPSDGRISTLSHPGLTSGPEPALSRTRGLTPQSPVQETSNVGQRHLWLGTWMIPSQIQQMVANRIVPQPDRAHSVAAEIHLPITRPCPRFEEQPVSLAPDALIKIAIEPPVIAFERGGIFASVNKSVPGNQTPVMECRHLNRQVSICGVVMVYLSRRVINLHYRVPDPIACVRTN